MTAWLAGLAVLAAWFVPAAAQIVHTEESLYNTIIIERDGNRLHMYFGNGDRKYTQTVRDLEDPQSLPVPYTRYLTLPLAYAESVHRIAEIGAATAQTSAYLARSLPAAEVTAVELDGTVLRLGKSHFGVVDLPNLTLDERDGRVFLTRSRDRFDIILVDAYRGPFVPFHMTTREFYQTVAARLTEGGAMALNIEPETLLFVPAIRTLGSVFQHVDLFIANDNVVAVAHNGAALSDTELRNRAATLEAQYPLRYPLAPMLAERQRLVKPLGGQGLLTDDFAPVEFLQSVKRHNARRDSQ